MSFDFNAIVSVNGTEIEVDLEEMMFDEDAVAEYLIGVLDSEVTPSDVIVVSDTVPFAQSFALVDGEPIDSPDNLSALSRYSRLAEIVENLGGEVVEAYADHYGAIYDADAVEDEYIGDFSSHEEIGEHFAETVGELNGDTVLSHYFDYERYGRDIALENSWDEQSGHMWWAH